MWLFNDLPLEALKERYGFTPPAGWAERLMRAAVRLSSGGSGSIISSEGLVMTNHHVGSDALQKLSTPGKNLLEEGFVDVALRVGGATTRGGAGREGEAECGGHREQTDADAAAARQG